MKYKTELINNIIESKRAESILDMIAPVYGDDYVSLWLIQVIGETIDKFEKAVNEYELQTVPQTATWGLDYYESEYGIQTDRKLTYEQRRNNLMNKMWSNGVMNPAKLAKIISNITGFETVIKERTGKRKFTICISSTPALVDEVMVRKKVDTLKPSHLLYDITYQTAVHSDVYVGGVMQRTKTVNLREV